LEVHALLLFVRLSGTNACSSILAPEGEL